MRLPAIDHRALTPEQAALYDAFTGGLLGGSRSAAVVTDGDGTMQGPFTVMLHHPAIGDPVQVLGGALRFRGALPDRAREIAILVTAASWASEFEWWAHAAIAARLGFDDELAALARGEPVTFTDPVEAAVFDAASALVARQDLDDDEYARAQAVLGDQHLVELTAIVGYYSLLALQMRVFRIDAPPDAPVVFHR